MSKITLAEVTQAITQQEQARDQALAQANFHAGYIAALKEIKARLEPEEQALEVTGNAPLKIAPVTDACAKTDRKR